MTLIQALLEGYRMQPCAYLAQHPLRREGAGERGEESTAFRHAVHDLRGERALADTADAVEDGPGAVSGAKGSERAPLVAAAADQVPDPAHDHAAVEPGLG